MRRLWAIFLVLVGLGVIGFLLMRGAERPPVAGEKAGETKDTALVKRLLREGLSSREFQFPEVVEAVSGKRVIPLREAKAGPRVLELLKAVLPKLLEEMNRESSPLQGLRRINEGSRFFEDGLLRGLNEMEGLRCEIPRTRGGKEQRVGYPDLKITDQATGEIFYLDPKLMEAGSVGSSLRTFYFEPKDETLKITDDAVHLLVGIEHDGVDGRWKFQGWRVVDLSGLSVRLKAEFQASNRELYHEGAAVIQGGAVKERDE